MRPNPFGIVVVGLFLSVGLHGCVRIDMYVMSP